MSKQLIKVVIGGNKKAKKVEMDTKLDKFREMLKNLMPDNCLFMLDDATIEKEDENEYTIKDIVKNNEVFCSTNTTSLNIFLNNKNISKLDISMDDGIESLIKELNGKIPKNSKIKFEDTELTFEEAKTEEITVKDIALDNSIYFINEEEKEEPKEEMKSKVKEPKKKKDSKNIEDQDNEKEEKFIHVYKNGDIIKMGMLDINITLSILRKALN